ncbi:MAG: DUF924 domain-containing protein [Gammaproteobacteria bacterium]|nr:DUF924 domain-containing protein [Gammaproteobacteria bacterium]MDE0253122.1 DUF924 domain-containing protein [Gammaproteobacteria bacterium]MDE0402930.1 DUF924 domain-containing protein [Gammaproteobacteria bacterium]
MTTPHDILDYWFEGCENDLEATQKLRDKWYMPSAEIDQEIKEGFSHVYDQAFNEELEDWKDSVQGCLALVIIFDQFSRNLFRKTARAFESDRLALELTHKCINNYWHKELTVPHQLFLFNPFQHSEDLTEQERGVKMVEKLYNSCASSWQSYVEASLDFFRAHRDTVAKFGRFPHRNEVLLRTSTPEELEFLKTAPRYGQ